ncbi:MAG: glycosyltransferase family 39 protein [Chloroflexales bacterium]|nr:glycosyltransferase family 39 protein [Chloroflexales bacterium]
MSTKPHAPTIAGPYVVSVLMIVGVFLLVRLPSLLALPLFNDEAIYLRRAVRFPGMLRDTLEDGKLIQELVLAAILRLPFDELVLGRLVSVLSGLGTLVALVYAGRVLQSPRAGLIAAALYVMAPLLVLHDLLAIPDSLLTFISIFVITASFRWATRERTGRREAALLGVLIGFAAMVKLTAVFLFWLPVLAVLTLTPRAQWPARLALLRTALIALLACMALLSPWHYGGRELHKAEFHTLPGRVGQLIENTKMSAHSLLLYLPAPLLMIVALAWMHRRRPPTNKVVFWLVLSSGAFIVTFLVAGATIFPRYLLPAYPLLLLASALYADRAWQEGRALQRTLVAAALTLALAWNGFFAYQLWRDPLHAPLAPSDRQWYLGSWTAGYGLPELHSWLAEQATSAAPITVVLHDRQRLIHIGTDLRLREYDDIQLVTIDLVQDDALAQLDALARRRRVFIPIDEEERVAFAFESRFERAALKQTYPNPLGTMQFLVYEYTR